MHQVVPSQTSLVRMARILRSRSVTEMLRSMDQCGNQRQRLTASNRDHKSDHEYQDDHDHDHDLHLHLFSLTNSLSPSLRYPRSPLPNGIQSRGQEVILVAQSGLHASPSFSDLSSLIPEHTYTVAIAGTLCRVAILLERSFSLSWVPGIVEAPRRWKGGGTCGGTCGGTDGPGNVAAAVRSEANEDGRDG
ncbi:hypothetical protein ONZ45_g12605 [Pleurotus djamor]|nr:hypothetical protein ONZ45_g12605 [Pleurotus djamor]